MLEVGEDIAARAQMSADAIDHGTPLFARIARLAEPVVCKRCGGNIWCCHGLGLGHTDSRLTRSQKVPSGLRKPGGVAKFKCSGNCSRQDGEEILEQRFIGLKIWRKLKEHGAQFPGSSKRLDGRKKARHEIFRSLQ